MNIDGASTVSFTIQDVDDLHYRGKIDRQRVSDRYVLIDAQ